MSKFGWSYPPGTTRLPWDNVQLTCEVCLGDPESTNPKNRCICPECDICGAAGDPACYGRGFQTNHALQIARQHLPLIEKRSQTLAEIQRQDHLADLHYYQLQQAWANDPAYQEQP